MARPVTAMDLDSQPGMPRPTGARCCEGRMQRVAFIPQPRVIAAVLECAIN